MTTVRPPAHRLAAWFGLLMLSTLPGVSTAQVKYPPLPETVDIQIRYRIGAARDERVRQYRALEAHLQSLGFNRKRQPEDDLDVFDPTAERFEGTIPSKNVNAVLLDPRVKTILFRPTDFKIPDDTATPVSLRIRIPTGYLAADQQRLQRQVVAQLEKLGFREGIGYDNDHYSLVRGDLPAGNLFRLMKDLRDEPAGWFVADTPRSELPSPLRDILPIRSIEVLVNSDLTFLAPQPLAPNRAKFTPDLRAVLDDAGAAAKPLVVEVILDQRLDLTELDTLRARFRATASRMVVNPTTQHPELVTATLEGAAGTVVTVRFQRASDLEAFARDPIVIYARLPRAAVETIAARPANSPAPTFADVASATRLAAFQTIGYRGQGTKIVVIGTSFPDLGQWMGIRFLSKTQLTPVSYIDLTAELSPDLTPSPLDPGAVGGATAAAKAAHAAAPGAAIVLVRVDPAAYFQLLTVARQVTGSTGYSDAMQSRIVEMNFRGESLRTSLAEAVEEYRIAFMNSSDEERARLRLARAKQTLERLAAEERKLTRTIDRATVLQNALTSLVGTDVVVNTLVWEDGYSVDGLSELSQAIDTTFASEALAGPQNRSATRPKIRPRPLWVQAASPSVGSVWGGPFLDVNGDGIMEFAAPGAPVGSDEWTNELNFLSVRGPDGTITPNLPAGAKVRLTVQWRETHDPTGYGGSNAIFPLTIRVFRQLDPEGKVRASDELREVARPVGGPYRLYAEPSYGVYEQVVEVTVAEAGRYCVRLEGLPIYDIRLPALRRVIQIQPRVFAEFVGGTAAMGRPVFASYSPHNVGVGIPGDAKAAIAVGETDKPLGTITTGLTGGGPGVELLTKPDLLAPSVAIDQEGGSGVSAGFTAGVLAAMIGSGAPPANIFRATGLQRGGPVMIPENWLKVVVPNPGSGRR